MATLDQIIQQAVGFCRIPIFSNTKVLVNKATVSYAKLKEPGYRNIVNTNYIAIVSAIKYKIA